MTEQQPPPASHPPADGWGTEGQFPAPWTAVGAPGVGGRYAPPSGLPYAALPPPPFQHVPMVTAGTNGLAVAALVCGLLGLIPLAAILGVVFGIIALRQLRSRPQAGRGQAIAGIVLGSIAVLFWGAVLAVAIGTQDTDSDGAAVRAPDSTVSVESLRVGECFDGLAEGKVMSVTIRDCDGPHEGEVIAKITLPEGPFPGEEEAAALAQGGCLAEMEDLLGPLQEQDIFYFYPESGLAWRLDRTAICVATAVDGLIGPSVRA